MESRVDIVEVGNYYKIKLSKYVWIFKIIGIDNYSNYKLLTIYDTFSPPFDFGRIVYFKFANPKEMDKSYRLIKLSKEEIYAYLI